MSSLSESDKVDNLYSSYGLLADCDPSDIGKHEETFKHILSAVIGSEKEKRLACQFIPVFFKHFPALNDKALEAMYDLCEDQDIAIRKLAIKELPCLCRDCPRLTKSVARTLSQLLANRDPSELRIVHKTLLSLFKIDAKQSIIGIFELIKFHCNLRSYCLRFLLLKMSSVAKDIEDAEAEDALLDASKNFLKDALPEEIPSLIKIVMSLNKSETIEGKLGVLDMLREEFILTEEFDPNNDELIERQIVILRYINQLLMGTSYGNSKYIILYIFKFIMPKLPKFKGFNEGIGYPLELFQSTAELSQNIDNFLEHEESLSILIEMFYVVFPTSAEDELKNTLAINFSYVECILFIMHRILKFNVSYINTDKANTLNYLLARFLQCARIVKGYINSLGNELEENVNDLPGGPRDNHKRKWSHSGQYSQETVVKDPYIEFIEGRQMVKWMKKQNGGQTINKDTILDAERLKNFSEMKKKSLKGLGYDICSNIYNIIREFFRVPLKFNKNFNLSFFPNESHLQKIEKRSALILNNESSGTNVDNITGRSTNARPVIAIYVPPSGKYSANLKRV